MGKNLKDSKKPPKNVKQVYISMHFKNTGEVQINQPPKEKPESSKN